MTVCSRCGQRLSLKEDYCSACGLHREGGKGMILDLNELSTNRSLIRNSDLLDRVRNHKIWNYYDKNSITIEKLYSEKERIRIEIDNIDEKIIRNLKNPPMLHFFAEKNKLEEQLETVYHYIVLRDKVRMIDKISKYYDLETLTPEIIKAEIARLVSEIRNVEDTLIFMEKDEPRHHDKMDFYQKRNKIREQLDYLHDYLELEEMEASLEHGKDLKLKSIYGKIPDWRLNQRGSRK
jgi:hypothetical protein